MKTIREFVEAATAALDAIDGADGARQAADDARKLAANSRAQAEQVRADAAKQQADALSNVERLKAQAADLQARMDRERADHETQIKAASQRSQEQIQTASETLEGINRSIGLKRAEHDELASAISRMKALAAELAKA